MRCGWSTLYTRRPATTSLGPGLVGCGKYARTAHPPYSLWTLQRLADGLAEQKGIRVAGETVRLQLKTVGSGFSRPQHQIASPDYRRPVHGLTRLKCWGGTFDGK